MAETAGLAVGIVGLVGLIGAFKDTIDLFSLIADTRHLGRQYEVLDTKLDIEKALLLQWANRVKLLSVESYDRRLDEAKTYQLVVRILESIRHLLTDTNNLRQRYGLRLENDPAVAPIRSAPALSTLRADLLATGLPEELFSAGLYSSVEQSGQTSDLQPFEGGRRISQMRMDKFVQEFEALQLRVGKQQEKQSISRKARWVIRDKQKFEALITNLSYLTSKLNEVLPVVDGDMAASQSMIRADLSSIRRDVEHLKVIVEASGNHHRYMAESTQRVIDELRQDRILNRLWFRRINEREEGIRESHESTFQWALQPSGHNCLPTWLRQGSGIYWVSGKAGSGKSTLMKYLYTHTTTKDILLHWASGDRLLLCHFFFSNLGMDEQKTQDGLLRTLLHQILSEHPFLIQEALPSMWRDVVNKESQEQRGDFKTAQDSEIALPSSVEMRYAFEIIVANISTIGCCCVFIDGLDEFVGNLDDGISFVQSLVKSERIKILLSSRPIPVCVAAFGPMPSLQLQDLTRSDIQKYVEDIVGGHPRMRSHISRFPEDSARLLHEIVHKSSGVFLWVILACRSIIRGFADHDRLSELRRRVDELPPELESMFMHMLGQVHKRHQEQGAQIFKICYTYQKTESPFLRTGLSALGLAFVDDYHAIPITAQKLTVEERVEICKELEGRLRSRCGGLLEFALQSHTDEASYGMESQITSAKVVFMHRTVFEFCNEDVWKLDCLQMSLNQFHAATALSLYGINMATQMLYDNRSIQAMDQFEEGLWWGAEGDREKPFDPSNCFFHLEPFLAALRGAGYQATATLSRLRLATNCRSTSKCPPVQLILAIETGATNWTKHHPHIRALSKNGCGTNSQCICCRPLLYHAFRKQFVSAKFDDRPFQGRYHSMEMIQTLLLCGCNATESVGSGEDETSFWSLWLDYIRDLCAAHTNLLDAQITSTIQNITKEFVNAGVNPQSERLDNGELDQFIQHTL